MFSGSFSSSSRFAFVIALAITLLFTGSAFAQSTASIQGTVTDSTGATVPNATVTVRNVGTGEERVIQTDASGNYLAAAIPPGTYRIEVKSQGMQTTVANNLPLTVGTTARQDFTVNVASTTETIVITAASPVIQESPVSVGTVINQRTVQEIPLNGRHFVDLALLIPGSVTPPANGFLTAPLRGQGSFAFNTAGAREDSINFMINGINMSDPVQNQITFQPTINTVQEFKTDNSTFSAEYGRNSGAIVNIATRSGSNEWHGEAYEYLRNSYFDARNFANPKNTLASGNLVSSPQAPFIRNQFGGDGGGYIKKDKTFFFLSYEGLRQRQAVPLTAIVLTDAQRTQVQTSSDAIVQKLLPLIPVANGPNGSYVSSATANVNIDQGTANLSHSLSDSHRLNVYFAIQQDLRGEPPGTDGNNLPGYGDTRRGRRQLLTFNDVKVLNSNWVNEFRLGYNRIHITFVGNNTLNAADFGMSTGVNAAIGLPQITVLNTSSGFAFGGANNFPQGRGDYSAATSDTVSWTHGRHSIKFGGEYRRLNNNNFTLTPGTFGFASITDFIADHANSFTVNNSNRANRLFVNSIGGFAMDDFKWKSNFTVQIGMRYDWFGTPSEAQGRFSVFDPTSGSLVQTNQPYNQSALNFQPRVGFAWDVFKNGKTLVRSAYALMTDQPVTGIVTGLAANPPFAFPVSYAAPTGQFVTFANAFQSASGSVAITSIAKNYKDAYAQNWNFNIQQRLSNDFGLMVSYAGSKGTDLNIFRNYNQFINGVRPYPTLSASSPIFPGRPLSNILVEESDGNSTYHALWVTATKNLSKGLQFSASYTFSKSIDYNSRNNQGLSVQDSYNIRGDRGLSDYDARHRFVLSGIYDLPFKGNRLIEGWEIAPIIQLQSGNPINFRTTNTSLTGAATQRMSVTGPVEVGFYPSPTGAASQIGYVKNPSVFVNPLNAFGNLGRNVVIGPGFYNVDVALVKNTKINERLNWQIRVDAFDLLNQTNFTQPSASSGFPLAATFGVITGASRFPAGDSGSSRQLQLSMKLIF
jgi:hypothetical protein